MTQSDFSDFHRIESRADGRTGLRAVFALHDLTLGPATGGVRRWRYASEDDAVVDAMRLARGMTRKNALAGLPFGGGKAVIMSDGAPVTKAQLRVLGRWIDEFRGEYVAAEDVGMRVEHMVEVRKETRFVTGIGDRGVGGHPGPKTARGVFRGIEVALGGSVNGASVAVQGLGAVGMALVELLAAAGARLEVADLDADRVAAAVRLGAERRAVDDVLLADVDVVAPCALGQILTPEVARALKARVVAGSANNQLASDEAGRILHDRGIVYAPGLRDQRRRHHQRRLRVFRLERCRAQDRRHRRTPRHDLPRVGGDRRADPRDRRTHGARGDRSSPHAAHGGVVVDGTRTSDLLLGARASRTALVAQARAVPAA